MHRLLKCGLWILATAMVLAPVSFMVTIVLLPLWRRIEGNLGIEAVGHSGPSDWCSYLVYAVLLGVASGLHAPALF